MGGADTIVLLMFTVGVIFIALAGIFVALRMRDAQNEGGRRERRRQFLDRLGEELELGERSGGRFEGRLDPDDRVASVEIVKGAEPTAIFTVEVHTAPRMRLSRETAKTRLAKSVGGVEEVQVGDRRFDDAIFIETAEAKRARQRARHHLARGALLREKILETFEKFAIRSIEIKKGVLEARAPLEALRRVKEYPELLELLAETARAFDRVGLKVKVLGGERLALASGEGRARCAYCHVDVTGEEPDLCACEVCGTVLHAGCYDELGRCPILGCPGTKPERSAARERA